MMSITVPGVGLRGGMGVHMELVWSWGMCLLVDPRKSVKDGVSGRAGRVARWCRVSPAISLVLGMYLQCCAG
jgi:hypothetical protein